MTAIRSFVVLGLLCGSAAAAAQPAPPARIVTGSERGTYIQIGRDLAQHVAGPAGIEFEVLTSKGSSENVHRLRSEPGVSLALVQSDVYQAFIDQAQAGNADAARLIKPMRVVLPLYDEEIYFIARADSPLNFVHEIKDKKINVGPIGSGTALSATTAYRLMFGAPIAQTHASFLSNEEALLKLASDKSLDVVVVVAGQPAKLLTELKPESRQYIKLLRLAEQTPEAQAALATYFLAMVRASNYPNWLTEDVPTLTTKALLVTYDYAAGATREKLTRFSRSLCRNFDTLRAQGHAKWQQVSLDLPLLGKGWRYYTATERELVRCRAHAAEHVARSDHDAAAPPCAQDKRVLGLCR
jgi:uncharacterized protein